MHLDATVFTRLILRLYQMQHQVFQLQFAMAIMALAEGFILLQEIMLTRLVQRMVVIV